MKKLQKSLLLNWFKKKNNLYKQFLARFETMYRYLRHDIVNPDILKGSQDKILESEAIGMAFPVDSEYFSFVWGSGYCWHSESPATHD